MRPKTAYPSNCTTDIIQISYPTNTRRKDVVAPQALENTKLSREWVKNTLPNQIVQLKHSPAAGASIMINQLQGRQTIQTRPLNQTELTFSRTWGALAEDLSWMEGESWNSTRTRQPQVQARTAFPAISGTTNNRSAHPQPEPEWCVSVFPNNPWLWWPCPSPNNSIF